MSRSRTFAHSGNLAWRASSTENILCLFFKFNLVECFNMCALYFNTFGDGLCPITHFAVLLFQSIFSINFTCRKNHSVFWGAQKLFTEYLPGLVICCWSFSKFALKTFLLTFQSDKDLFSILPGNKSFWYGNTLKLLQSKQGKHISLHILVYYTSSEYFLYTWTL